MNACERIKHIDPEGHDVNCKKLPPISKDTADMVWALKREMELSASKEKNFEKLVYSMDQFLTESSETKKEQLLKEIQKIALNYSTYPEFIEKMGYFSLARYRKESKPVFILAAAHKVHELSQMWVPTGGEFANLQDDFYGMMLMRLQESTSENSPLLQRIFEVLGDSFQDWLRVQLSENPGISEEEKTMILFRYANYRSE